MKKLILLLGLLSLSGCWLDETATLTQEPVIMLYNGSYGYWYGGVWYAAPPGFTYGAHVYWGPYHYQRRYIEQRPRREFRGGFYYRNRHI